MKIFPTASKIITITQTAMTIKTILQNHETVTINVLRFSQRKLEIVTSLNYDRIN